MKKNKINKTKELIVQILYSVKNNKKNINNTINFLLQKKNKKYINLNYLNKFIKKIEEKNKIIKTIIKSYITETHDISILEKIILKIHICEIFFFKQNNLKSKITENIELTKKFCSKKSITLIKNILYKINKLYVMLYIIK